MSATLSARGIARRGPHGGLGEVSLRLDPGSLVAVRGPEPECAALVKCLYRTYEPDHGSLSLEAGGDRIDLAHAEPRTVAWLRRRWLGLHDGRLRALPNRSPVRVVAGPAAGVARERAAGAVLRDLGVDRIADPVGLLDDRERRVVSLAAQLLQPAPIVLAHTPLAGLDDGARECASTLLGGLRDAGCSVLVTLGAGEVGEVLEHDVALQLRAPT